MFTSICSVFIGFIALLYDGHPGGLLAISLPGFLVGLVVYLKSPKKRNSKDAADELLKWTKLKELGSISEEEFEKRKKDLLD